MIGQLLALLGGAIAADWVVEKTTGKHIHEHVFEWWCDFREEIVSWLQDNQHLGINKLAMAVLDRIDGVAVRTKKMLDIITLAAVAIDEAGEETIVQVREVPVEEAYDLFPELRNTPVAVIIE